MYRYYGSAAVEKRGHRRTEDGPSLFGFLLRGWFLIFDLRQWGIEHLHPRGHVILDAAHDGLTDLQPGNHLRLILCERQCACHSIAVIGRDQPVEEFIRKTKELKPDIIGASALLSTTMIQQKKLVEALEKEGLRNRVKVMIGGAPVSREWAEKIGADAYARNAAEAAQTATRLMGAAGLGGKAV